MKKLTQELPAKINSEHQACLQAAGDALEHAMRCGDLLSEAKASCRHGEWQKWLANHFEASARTAQGYMRLADNRELLEPKPQGPAVLGIEGALRMLAAPKSEGRVPDLNEAIAHFPEIKGVHEVANIFPLPNEKEHAMMVDDIRRFGLMSPVKLTEDGLLVDGKWRVLACFEAGVELRYEIMRSEPLAFVMSMNWYRTHMTDAQLTARMAREEELKISYPSMQ